MPPQIAKLGHVSLVTPDLDQSTWFFRDVVGLEETERDRDMVFLRGWGEFEHHTLKLVKGPEAKLDHVGWRTARPEDVEEFESRLSRSGVEVTKQPAGEERGHGESIHFRVAGTGHPFEIYYDVEKPLAPEERRSRLKNQPSRAFDHGVSPRRVDHVNLWTDNPAPSAQWLEDVLGFKTRECVKVGPNDGMLLGSWMSVTTLVHDLAMMADPGRQPNRFHHIAYFLDNWQDVLRGMDILGEHGVEIDLGPGRHGISQAFFCYVKDPGSGHRLELFSGGYHIFDPDWEPVVWREQDMKEGLIWWGPEYMPGQGSSLDDTTASA